MDILEQAVNSESQRELELNADPLADLGGDIVSDEELLAREEQRKYDQPVLAGTVGALRGASIGLSDLAARGLGLEEEVRKLQEYNPTASMVGEVAGTIGTALVGPGAAIAKGANILAKPIGSSLARSAAANALEGAAYGLGGTISEQALGSERDVAESLVANVGMGTLLGGGLSMAGHGVAKVGEKLSGQVKKVLKGEDALSKWLGTTQDFYDDVAGQVAPDIDALRRAAMEEGIPLTPGMISDSPVVKGMESSLAQAPTKFGEMVRTEIKPTFKRIQEQAGKILEEQSDKTSAVVGDEIKSAMISRIHEMYDPVRALYDDIGMSTGAISITPEFRSKIVKNIDEWATTNTLRGSEPRNAAKFVMDNMSEDIDMPLDKIKAIASDLGGRANAAKISGKTSESMLIKDLQNKVNGFYERQLRRVAIEEAATKPEGQEIGRQLIADVRSAKKGYRELMKFIEDISGEAKLGKIRGVSQFLDKIEDIPSEKLAEKLFDKKSVRSLNFFRQQFPDQFDAVRRVEIAKIRNKAKENSTSGSELINVKKLAKATEGYSKEALEILLGPESVRSLKNLKVIEGRVPKIGPSGTPEALDYQNIFSPSIWFRDAARYSAYKGGKLAAEVADNQVQSALNKINSFFDLAKKPVVGVSTVGATSINESNTRKIKDVEEIAMDPNKYVQNIQENTKGLAAVDPGLQASIANTAMEAVNFLSERAPKNPLENSLFKRKWRPSDAELSKFNRYLKAVDDPFSILDDLDAGLLTPEGVEAVRTIYPSIYNQFIQMTVNKIGEIDQELPLNKKLQVSLLLGQPLSAMDDLSFVQRLQQGAVSQGIQEDMQNAPKNKKIEGDFIQNTVSQSNKLIATRGQ